MFNTLIFIAIPNKDSNTKYKTTNQKK